MREKGPILALAIRFAVQRAVADRARIAIKWPNDVLIDGAKVSGKPRASR